MPSDHSITPSLTRLISLKQLAKDFHPKGPLVEIVMRTGLSSGFFHFISVTVYLRESTLGRYSCSSKILWSSAAGSAFSGMQVGRAQRVAAVNLSKFQIATKTSLCGALSPPDKKKLFL